MAVPPIGNIVTPANFIISSNQGMVQLNWQFVPFAIEYYINRSTDNLTFTNIGMTPFLQFQDTTATVGTIYYYTVQASNGTNSSPATLSLAGQSLNPGGTTVANIRLECQQRTDLLGSPNITTQEWNSMINQSFKELWNIIAQKFGDDYYVASPYTYTTINGIQFYPLPVDFKALLGVEVALNPGDPNSWITIKQFEFIQRNLYNYPNQYTFYGITNLKYRLNGNNLYIVPIPQAGQTIRIWYVPRPNQLINDTDTVDAVAGWEEYIVADVCLKALAKQEQPVDVFAAQKLAMLKRIEEEAENRNIGESQRVSDVRRTNFAWGDSGEANYGGFNY